ncbi:MAG: Dabb family protein [Acidimicrobiales bacterium]
MFRHCAMFRWKPEVSDEQKSAISAGLDALVPLATSYVHGPDAAVNEGNWDYVVMAEFDSVEHYRIYADDDGHQTLINDLIKPAISDRAAIQLEF